MKVTLPLAKNVFLYSSKFITYAPFLILFGKLFLEDTPLNLGSFL